jgi:hypothetical protein
MSKKAPKRTPKKVEPRLPDEVWLHLSSGLRNLALYVGNLEYSIVRLEANVDALFAANHTAKKLVGKLPAKSTKKAKR